MLMLYIVYRLYNVSIVFLIQYEIKKYSWQNQVHVPAAGVLLKWAQIWLILK